MITWGKNATSSATTLDVLRAKDDDLQSLFLVHEGAVRDIQRLALQDIVPDIVDQLELDDEETEWVRMYLKDTGALR